MKQFIEIKPLSVNRTYQPALKTKRGKGGKKIKYPSIVGTKESKVFKEKLQRVLPDGVDTFERMNLFITVYYNNEKSDIDNFLKSFIDGLQVKYGFNDNIIDFLVVRKKITDGEEGFQFIFTPFSYDFEEIEYKTTEIIRNMWD